MDVGMLIGTVSGATVRASFKDATLLIIAHRIKTIVDCHKVADCMPFLKAPTQQLSILVSVASK